MHTLSCPRAIYRSTPSTGCIYWLPSKRYMSLCGCKEASFRLRPRRQNTQRYINPFITPTKQIPSRQHSSFIQDSISYEKTYPKQKTQLTLRTASHGIAKSVMSDGENDDYDLSENAGEDASFHRDNSIGIADGVGSWSRHKQGNAGRWARMLMHYCSMKITQIQAGSSVNAIQQANQNLNPVDILQWAYDKSVKDAMNSGVLGSSTALIALLVNNHLQIANIGDCSCMIVRKNSIVFRSKEQLHSFNFPYQIGPQSSQKPSQCAQLFSVPIELDDIIILSTDGLNDNLFDAEILSETLHYMNSLAKSMHLPKTGESTSPPLSDDKPQSKKDLSSEIQSVDEIRQSELNHKVIFEKKQEVAKEMMSSNKVSLSQDENQSENSDHDNSLLSWISKISDQHLHLPSWLSTDENEQRDYQALTPFFNSNHDFHRLISQFDPEYLAEQLCMRARNVFDDDMVVVSPFQEKAQEEGLYYVGGKRDDVNVVIAVVSRK